MQKKKSGRKILSKKELKKELEKKANQWDSHPNKPFPIEGSVMNRHKYKNWLKKKRKMAQQSQRINRKK